ncbi:MAG: dTDP-glucose 4,6-dehydratase [Betaproteobacteria bacterium RIFCSPLOWO2_02_FULL_64_12]|nr:MAG: dTDP-glucose 4,6-dehydratase [Betaproteobacteria bacterium RIFCSPLOWO2_02_FULL_64_12]
MIMVTGGAGFIGSNFVNDWFAHSDEGVVNLDKLTYAGNLANLAGLRHDSRHVFVRGDICDRTLLRKLFEEHAPRAVIHFAAESHVDRSIHGPAEFMQTNVLGSFCLLEEARAHWQGLSAAERNRFRLIHVSTDEVYGSLSAQEPAFTEATPYAPNSPYSASKAGSDHLARAYHHTYGLPVVTTNCSNNYGPYQFPEKLIPLMLMNAMQEKPLPVYGDGRNVRDWLYVGDHCSALRTVLDRGMPGEVYNIGGANEKQNIEVVHEICSLLDELRPRTSGWHRDLVSFVTDRPGHDRRYAMNIDKIRRELGWTPGESFASGLRRTVNWYLEHRDWAANVQSGDYRRWVELNYAAR